MRQPTEDLFEDSKMSFGEHLDELRGALIKAVAALAIGVLLGFTVANHVVRFIQTPLQEGLKEFRTTQAATEFDKYIQELRDKGQEVPEDLEQAATIFKEKGLAPRVWRLDPGELAKMLESQGFRVQPPDGDADVGDNDTEGSDTELLPFVLWTPFENDPTTQAMGTSILEAFSVWVKAALLVGVVLSSPFSFYFLWSFVASGLYPHERRYVTFFGPFSLGLFLLGAGVAFFVAMGYVLDTMFWFYRWLEIDPTPRIGEWISFALILPLGFGAGFQLPLVMLFLERIGVFRVEDYLNNWRYGVLAIAIASTLLTPSDWQSMVLLAVPMVALYFGGIALCRLLPKRESPLAEA